MSHGEIAVSPVVTPGEKREFIEFQYEANRPFPAFVPPLVMDRKDVLNPKKNPWFAFGIAQLFLARLHGKVVGRIAAIEDPRYNAFHGVRYAWFGFFECVEDARVASALLKTVEDWARVRGLSEVLGPANFSSNTDWGMLVDSFDRAPLMLMPYNPPYYPALVEACGFTKSKDLWAWDIDLAAPPPEKVVRVARKMQEREGIAIRRVNLKDWPNEVRRFREIYNAAWEKNWGFVPTTEREFAHMGKDLKLVVKPELAFVAEVESQPVAFSLTLPDANPAFKKANGYLTTLGLPIGLVRMLLELRRFKGGRLMALGVRREFRRRGLDSLLVLETFLAAQRLGLQYAEVSWTLEDNDMVNRVIEVFGGKRSKTYRIYGKHLDATAVAQA